MAKILKISSKEIIKIKPKNMTYTDQCNYWAKINRDRTEERLLAFYYSWADYVRKLKESRLKESNAPRLIQRKFMTEEQRFEELKKLKMI